MTDAGAILVLDDDMDVLRAARLALTGHFERVQTISAPEEIGRVLCGAKFDAAVLDMNFTGGGRSGAEGLDALGSVRAHDPNLSVVMMTAFGGVSLAVEALKRGAVDFILKPWRNDKLVAAVEAAVKLTQARRSEEGLDLDTLERNAILRALARRDGNVSVAASDLGLSRQALYRRMAKYGL